MQDKIYKILNEVSQVPGVNQYAIDRIREAVARGDEALGFDGIDFFTLTELKKAGFNVDISEIEGN